MAKKKVETEVDETPVMQPESTETVADVPAETVEEVAEQQVNETPNEEVKPTKKAKITKAETEIPTNVKELLKVFKRYPELLITKDGGVFTPDTKLPEKKGAILYKNPFYNN